ncbi:hypothetical protein XENOCAPTIV_002681, partial [Xenoophorus captivus]
LATLFTPLAAYHRVLQHVYVKLEPVLQWLDFSVRGYMMSKPIDNQYFPSINPDATLMDDDDDTSIGLPSLGLSGPMSHRASVLDVDAHLDSDQEDLDGELSLGGFLPASDFSGELAGAIASNMIQAALAGAMQPRPPATQRRQAHPRAVSHRSYRKQSSSEFDTDLDAEDFEMLDQSELNQMDPFGGGGGARRGESQGSNFLSSLLDWRGDSERSTGNHIKQNRYNKSALKSITMAEF